MNKQDMQGVRTPSDLERKYDLGAIVGIKKAVLQAENQITKINSTLEKFIISTLGSLENMQSQIDGNITTWFNSGEPKPETYPTNEWETEEEKINHIGDLYYDRNTGYAYRYESTEENTYNWEKIRDNDVVEALAIANAAKDTADNKRRVFVVQPTPPYECGDLWITSDGEIYICQIEKDDKQTYAEKDFVVATKYTDDTYAKQVENQLQVVRGAVTTIIEGMDRFSVDIDTLENDMTLAKTQILANTSQIALSVLKDAVIAAINLSNENILIQAKKINLQGAVTMSSLAEDVADEIEEISTNTESIKNNIYYSGTTEIDGGKLRTGSVSAKKIDVADLFAQNITASGTITGATLKGTDAEITKGKIGAFTLTDKLAATVNAYVAPSSTERDKVKDYIYNSGTLTSTELSASDLNKDGSVTIKDLLLITKILCGDASYSAQAGAKQTSVSMEINPTNAEKLIRLTGTNAWGRSIEQYFGINGLKTDNVIAKSVVANSIETTAGANLDTINSNLDLKQNAPTWLSSSNIDTFVGTGANFSWGYGLISNEGYLAFNLGWISIQFKVSVIAAYKRIKYGNNNWTAWSSI